MLATKAMLIEDNEVHMIAKPKMCNPQKHPNELGLDLSYAREHNWYDG